MVKYASFTLRARLGREIILSDINMDKGYCSILTHDHEKAPKQRTGRQKLGSGVKRA